MVTLRYWQDLSYAEIARIVGTTESAVKSRLHRARRMLQGKLYSYAVEMGFLPEVCAGVA